MDAAFMSQVKERVAKATEAVASLYDASVSDDSPELPTLPELLVELASNTTHHRCGECGAVLMEGPRSRICFACGELQPAASRTSEIFDFETSLALQLFFDSLKLDGSALGIKRVPSPPKAQRGLGSEQRQKVAPGSPSSNVKSKLFAEVEEDDIWESADGEIGAVNWTQQLAEANDFFSAGVPADRNSFPPATQQFHEPTTDEFDDFFQAARQPQPQSQNRQHNLDFFQSAAQSKVDLNFRNDDVGLFALTQNHPSAQISTSAVHLQDSSGQKSAEVPTKPSVLDHQGSSNDFFEQLEGLNLSRGRASQGHDKEPAAAVKNILNELPDLSFMLADHLVVPGGKKSLSTMWSFKEIE